MKVLILDAYNLIHRARSGFTKGENAIVFNFFRGIKPLLEKFNPDKCYFVLEGYPKHRYEKIKTYKAGRPKQDDSFKRQKNLIKEIIQKYTSLIVAHHPDFECDDVAYTIAKHHCIMGDEVTLVSSDSDFIQMLQEMNIKIFHPIKKKFLSPPEYSYIEWKSLCGDKTDNISGIPGVGPKTAEKLVKSKELFESKIINVN